MTSNSCYSKVEIFIFIFSRIVVLHIYTRVRRRRWTRRELWRRAVARVFWAGRYFLIVRIVVLLQTWQNAPKHSYQLHQRVAAAAAATSTAAVRFYARCRTAVIATPAA